MGYWAELDQDGIVQRVIVAEADFITTQPGTWVETDIKKNYAGPGHKWNKKKKEFIPPEDVKIK